MSPSILRPRNQLLSQLPDAEWQRWCPALEPIDLTTGQVLHESGACSSHVYFPLNAIVSVCYSTATGDMTEIALIGHEGMAGLSSLMGGDALNSHSVVLNGGTALRLRSALLRDAFESPGPVQRLVLRYTQTLIAQIGQTAVCNRHHSVDQALSRWLLLCLDRVPDGELVMTQELMANMLGVRREGVTDAALKLQRAGLIRYRRGHITVIDRQRLERLSCDCYRAVKDEYERLLHPKRATDCSA